MDDLKAILDAAAKEVTVDCWADIQPLREAFCRTSLSSGPSTHRLERMAPDLAAEVVRLRKALEPFSEMAGELFARNYNKEDMVIALDTPDKENRLTFGDFLNARAALEGRG